MNRDWSSSKGDQQRQVSGTGTAINIIYSDWFTPAFVDWRKITEKSYLFSIIEAKITQDIINKGVVLAYSRQVASADLFIYYR
ncbi:MAG: hypothetical protein U5M51_11935 [Emticicia sp.]|nr:hypothetical protein [Emticicia sp.]